MSNAKANITPMSGVVIVVLKSQEQQDRILEQYEMSYFQQLLIHLFNHCNWSTEKSKYIYHKDKFINIERAPEPSDILWQNQGIDSMTRIKWRLVTYCVTFFLLVASYALILGINYAKKKITDQEDYKYVSEISRKSLLYTCLLYTSPSPRDRQKSRMPSSA
eukprot:TRINITY_DN8335_c0_g1_i5.p2 TRINITY_DN8335_c0_g1~~TRINITY_DN8335_c0_g1_i5.p2  ORF type:complete len:162 (-),score=18.72 TRINITY_DN8335_c0_g1_i5:64-549(-)